MKPAWLPKIVAPDLFPLKSSAKLPVLKDGVVPEMQMCHPQDPQNSRPLISSHLRSVTEAPNMAGMSI